MTKDEYAVFRKSCQNICKHCKDLRPSKNCYEDECDEYCHVIHLHNMAITQLLDEAHIAKRTPVSQLKTGDVIKTWEFTESIGVITEMQNHGRLYLRLLANEDETENMLTNEECLSVLLYGHIDDNQTIEDFLLKTIS